MQVAIHPGYFLPIHCKLVQNECLIETHKERHLSFWSFPMLIAALVVFTDFFFLLCTFVFVFLHVPQAALMAQDYAALGACCSSRLQNEFLPKSSQSNIR